MQLTESLVKQKCHDCGTKIEITPDEIKNGVLLTYKDSDNDIDIFKCDKCFEQSESLENFRECEIYSRIVGYLRPIKEVNPGKAQEIKERKTFNI